MLKFFSCMFSNGIPSFILDEWFEKSNSGDLNRIKSILEEYPNIINKKEDNDVRYKCC